MHPVLFQIGNYAVKAYPFFLILSALVGFLGSYWLAKKRGLPAKSVIIILLSSVIASFIGGRLLNVLINWTFYQQNSEKIWAFSSQGFSMFGGIILAVLVAMVLSWWWKINIWRLGDSVAPFLGLSIVLQRIGCFLNGCCFGQESKLPWAVTFPFFSPAHKFQLSVDKTQLFSINPVHPTQLYELLAGLVASLIAVYGLKKKWPDGLAFLVAGLWFVACRWGNYYFRVMPVTFEASRNFYPMLYASLMVMVMAAIILRLTRKATVEVAVKKPE